MADKQLAEVGRSGLLISSGIVFDEFLATLRGSQGRKTFREMSDNDPVIGGILMAFEKTLTRLEWHVESAPNSSDADLETAKFVQECFEDMNEDWASTLSSILSMMVYGWSYHEIVYKVRGGMETDDLSKQSRFTDGKIGWRKWPIRSQESFLRWETDEYGEVTALEQFVVGAGRLIVPIQKALLFRTTTNRNNPEGRSLIRNSYRPWYFKKRIEEIEAIGVERDLAGLPVALLHPKFFSANADDDQVALRNEVQRIVQSIKRNESEGVLFPLVYDEHGNKEIELTLMSSGGQRQFDTDKIVTRYNQQIAMSLLADFLMLGHEAVGTQSLGSDKLSLWMMAVEAVAKSVTSVVNQYAIPRLLKVNGMTAENLPQLVHGTVTKVDLTVMGQFLYQMVEAGVVVPDRELEEQIRSIADLPPIDDETREDIGIPMLGTGATPGQGPTPGGDRGAVAGTGLPSPGGRRKGTAPRTAATAPAKPAVRQAPNVRAGRNV